MNALCALVITTCIVNRSPPSHPPPYTPAPPVWACCADLVLNCLFTAEMIIRIIALGGITEYLSSTWNLFDALMVFAGYTVFIPMGDANQGMEGLRALRALRALRPLRTIAR